jgi:hypothetical protein
MKKKTAPTFDELKNPDLVYHYSRADRIALNRHPEPTTTPKKFLTRVFGGNKTTARMFIFYIILAIAMWLAFMFGSSDTKRKEFNFTNGNKMVVRLVQDKFKYGLSLFLENTAANPWVIRNLMLSNKEYVFSTDVAMELRQNEFDTLFLPIPLSISNIGKLTVTLK